MADRTLVYFVSDVHLGLDVNDPADREARFVSFLKSIPKDRAKSLYLLHLQIGRASCRERV